MMPAWMDLPTWGKYWGRDQQEALCSLLTSCGYACLGGWHDFFDVPDVLVPWSEAREAAEGHVCRRHTFDTVDALLYDLSMGWDGVDAIGAMNVRP